MGCFLGGGGFRVGVPPHNSPRWSGSSCTSWNWGAEPPPWPCFSSALVTTAGVFSWLVIYGGGPGGGTPKMNREVGGGGGNTPKMKREKWRGGVYGGRDLTGGDDRGTPK